MNRRRTVQRQIGTRVRDRHQASHRFAAIGDGVRLAAFNGMQNLSAAITQVTMTDGR